MRFGISQSKNCFFKLGTRCEALTLKLQAIRDITYCVVDIHVERCFFFLFFFFVCLCFFFFVCLFVCFFVLFYFLLRTALHKSRFSDWLRPPQVTRRCDFFPRRVAAIRYIWPLWPAIYNTNTLIIVDAFMHYIQKFHNN